MKWFIPLLIWAIALLLIASLDAHFRALDGRGEDKEESRALGQIWLWGCGFWLIVAIIGSCSESAGIGD